MRIAKLVPGLKRLKQHNPEVPSEILVPVASGQIIT